MTEYKVWAFARSAAPNLPALEEQLAEVMREADRRGYIIVNSCMEQKYGTEFWRPDLFAMLTAVQHGRVNAVMVQSLDPTEPRHYNLVPHPALSAKLRCSADYDRNQSTI